VAAGGGADRAGQWGALELVVDFFAGLSALQVQHRTNMQSVSQIRDWLARNPLHVSVPS
jgi:hypothetical protein